MRFDSQVLFRFSMPYALGWMVHRGEPCVVAATEDHGPVVVCHPPFTSAEVLTPGPVGCMSLVADPAKPEELYAIMGCFLGYNFHGGAVYRVSPQRSDKLVDLAFGHRMEIVEKPQGRYIAMSSLAETKDSPQDWSRPGSMYAMPLDGSAAGRGDLILENLHKNHGMFQGTWEGRRTLLVSGVEGVFALDSQAPGWNFRKILDHEVSEIALFDLDGDGHEELVTIEPFHGNVLALYKQIGGKWAKTWEAELDYGHCVTAVSFQGIPSVLVSNLAGSKDLLWFDFGTGAEPRRQVIAEGVGAANFLVARHEGKDLLLATNQVRGELVRYAQK